MSFIENSSNTLTRRDLLKGGSLIAGSLLFSRLYGQSPLPEIVRPSIFRRHLIEQPEQLSHRLKIGASFSVPAMMWLRKSLGLPFDFEAVKGDFEEIVGMGFDMIRHSSRLDIDPKLNEEYLKFQLETAKNRENVVVIGDKQFPFPDRFAPAKLMKLDPRSKEYIESCLQLIERSSFDLADNAYFDSVETLQLSNEPFCFFKSNPLNPPQRSDFVEKIREILDPLERKYLVTDNIFDNNPVESWKEVKAIKPDFVGINIYSQMGARYYKPDEIIAEIFRRFPIEGNSITIPNGYVTESQFFGWPIKVPFIGTLGEEDLEKFGIFTGVDRENIFYIAVSRFPRVFPWEVDKALAFSKIGKPKALNAIKEFLKLRDYWNGKLKEV